ncbi:DUF1206 domain-containing protein [Acetobacterium sp.]|uniref:DUF1206 domain-containing protein n=1 Tax=Acetobacterium sp. TaxID=1872094 RepID=UPI002F414618
MTGKKNSKGKINGSGPLTANNAALNKTFETLARLGYAARGIIYFVIGLLAVLLAVGYGGKTTDQQGAISVIGTQPAGRILLWLVLIGLVCYSLWGLIRVIFNPFHQGHDAKGFAVRIGYLVSAAAYGLLVIPTYALISGGAQPAQSGAQQGQIQQYTAQILVIPFGQLLVGIMGIILILVGLMQFFQGLSSGFDRRIHLTKLNPVQLRRVRFLGRLGTIARGIVFALIGFFIVMAAYTANSQQIKGFDSTLTYIVQQPYGVWLMGAVALGLISLGLYSLCMSVFFRLKK